jgi:hypothetical protein
MKVFICTIPTSYCIVIWLYTMNYDIGDSQVLEHSFAYYAMPNPDSSDRHELMVKVL